MRLRLSRNLIEKLLKMSLSVEGLLLKNEFIKQGIVTVATGKDPQTGGICPHCGGSGYKGRVGIYELMDYTDDIKTLILDGKSAFEI